MSRFSRLFSLLMAFVFIMSLCVQTFADGEDVPASAELKETYPYSYVLMEGSTGTLLYADNGNAPFVPFHSAKLMTLLLLCEAIDRNELSIDTIVTVSKHANSMQGSQIWLDVGEKIVMSELVTAITVGNANDACVAIAEAVGGTEEAFVAQMNSRADELGMSATKYADCTGTVSGSITTACDTAILASALSKYDWLTEYMTTWMTAVRGGKAEVISQNRVIRSYEPATGMKAYFHRDCGNCVIASAKKDGLTMICVIFGEKDEFEHFKTAKEKMNIGFLSYSMYAPKRKDILLEPVKIKGGVNEEVETGLGELGRFIVRNSQVDKIKIEAEYFDDVQAPVYPGQKVGRAVYSIDDEEVYSVDIIAVDEVKKINIFYAALKIIRAIFCV